MAVYLVTYDLKQGHGTHDYADLYGAMDSSDSVKILYSVYLVSTTWNATQLQTHFRGYMDPKDRIWVSRVTADHAGLIMAAGVAWLERHASELV